ncbi:DUF4097 family beta strand repeat-containing protein [Candidatus Viridilinea mediisalina]|uniref:YvlB/LiaX N-terminal domain-containing protein n=1 Tax=Candidatus Viridilinea mediisalina TaxID=2024553 RepID=A0A2A6RJR6_9CHLR|nr:hypothetical protein [Candidatus Viridilinea mediisalina]PDW03129.1 hypothetical protein CJ255_10460 [Candidatus Viridilinea mediisalina]
MSEQYFPAGPQPRVRITRLHGDLLVSVGDDEGIRVAADALISDLYQEDDEVVISTCESDLELQVPARTALQIERCEGSVRIADLRLLQLEHVAGDLHVAALLEQLEAERIAGDVEVTCATPGELQLSSVGGDLILKGAAKLQAGQIGGDCSLSGAELQRVQLGNVGGDLNTTALDELHVANVGGDLSSEQINGALVVGNVGGDVRLGRIEGDLDLGAVGGDLSMGLHLADGRRGRTNVAGDVRLNLPEQPNLRLRALVMGKLRGVDHHHHSGGPQRLDLHYGTGAASLDLTVAGDLRIKGGGTAEAQQLNEADTLWSELGREFGELGRELGRLGRELGEELGEELASAFRSSKGKPGKREAHHRADKRAHHKEARAAKREAHRAKRARLHLRINEHEWQLDPERIERIKEQARQAAANGLAGAIDAVERAISRLRNPDAPDMPPSGPSSRTAATGQTIRIEREPPDPALEAQREQERESILHMVAEGRISPEEGDVLLEALG